MLKVHLGLPGVKVQHWPDVVVQASGAAAWPVAVDVARLEMWEAAGMVVEAEAEAVAMVGAAMESAEQAAMR